MVRKMMMPARKIRPSKGRNYRSKISRSKSLRVIHAESLLERDYVKLCNFDKMVEQISFQPIGIKYNYKGRTRKYFPDYLLRTIEGKYVLVEVKLKKYADTDKNRAKFMAGEEHCRLKGWSFMVVTEDQVRPGYLQHNLTILLGAKVHKEAPIVIEYILTLLSYLKQVRLGDLMIKCSLIDNPIFMVNVFKLIYTGRIVTDLIDSKLSKESILQMGSGSDGTK
jgi:hypothetical protein